MVEGLIAISVGMDDDMGKRKKKLSFDELCAIRNQVYTDLEAESDRGLALVTADYLSNLLEALLRQVFVDGRSKGMKDILSGLFAEVGPLGTFATRTRLAFLMGLIGTDTYHALEVIRDLRNDAAHSVAPFSLESPGPREMCRRLTDWEACQKQSEAAGQTGRQQFMFAMWWVAVELMLRTGRRRHAEIGKEFCIPFDDLPNDDDPDDVSD